MVTLAVTGIGSLKEISFRAEPGALLALTGPPGAGKTLLLRALAGLERPSVPDGEIRWNGRRIDQLSPRDRRAFLLGKDMALWPHLPVGEQVALGLRFRGRPRRAARNFPLGLFRLSSRPGEREDEENAFREAMELAGVTKLEKQRPDRLTPEEAFRVALARALAVRPVLLLLDDPLAGWPAGTRRQLWDLVREIARHRRLVVVWAVADPEEALAGGERVLFLHEGRLAQQGNADEVYTNPVHLEVARFFSLHGLNLIEVQVVTSAAEGGIRAGDGTAKRGFYLRAGPEWELPLCCEQADRVAAWSSGEGKGREVLLMGLRPEEISVLPVDCPIPSGWGATGPVQPARVEPHGWYSVAYFQLPSDPAAGSPGWRVLRVNRRPEPALPSSGAQVRLSWPAAAQLFFDPVSERRV
ncbi:MAG TPA: ABC transporter ATP-binding protein [Firmicutes bacterium]|nr:ABC transporter ATP-binding protein [Bacillota bacterium]